MISVGFQTPDKPNAGEIIHACMIALTLKSLNPPEMVAGLELTGVASVITRLTSVNS
jgi:hypothetical protein